MSMKCIDSHENFKPAFTFPTETEKNIFLENVKGASLDDAEYYILISKQKNEGVMDAINYWNTEIYPYILEKLEGFNPRTQKRFEIQYPKEFIHEIEVIVNGETQIQKKSLKVKKTHFTDLDEAMRRAWEEEHLNELKDKTKWPSSSGGWKDKKDVHFGDCMICCDNNMDTMTPCCETNICSLCLKKSIKCPFCRASLS